MIYDDYYHAMKQRTPGPLDPEEVRKESTPTLIREVMGAAAAHARYDALRDRSDDLRERAGRAYANGNDDVAEALRNVARRLDADEFDDADDSVLVTRDNMALAGAELERRWRTARKLASSLSTKADMIVSHLDTGSRKNAAKSIRDLAYEIRQLFFSPEYDE